MAAPKNVRNTKAPYVMDPLLNFKWLITWDKKVVAGVSKIGALSRTTEVVTHREGGAPQVSRKIPGQVEYGPITLERGLIIDVTFEQWANKVWWYENSGKLGNEVSLKDFRKDLTIQLCNQAGQIMKQYMAFNCWPSEYTGLPELDSNANAVAIESMTLQNEGWQRDDSYKAPKPPTYVHPTAPGTS